MITNLNTCTRIDIKLLHVESMQLSNDVCNCKNLVYERGGKRIYSVKRNKNFKNGPVQGYHLIPPSFLSPLSPLPYNLFLPFFLQINRWSICRWQCASACTCLTVGTKGSRNP